MTLFSAFCWLQEFVHLVVLFSCSPRFLRKTVGHVRVVFYSGRGPLLYLCLVWLRLLRVVILCGEEF